MNLPVNLDVERLIVALPMIDDSFWPQYAHQIQLEDFSLESHRRIWSTFRHLHDAGAFPDRASVATALMESGQLESVGGLSYLCSLDDGMPQLANVENYIRVLVAHSNRRRVIQEATAIYQRAQDLSLDADELIAGAEKSFADISRRTSAAREYETVAQFAEEYPQGFEYLISPNKYPGARGIPTPWSGFNGLIGGLRPGDLIVIAARPSMGKSALALQIGANAAVNYQKRVSVISLEMAKAAQLRRMVAGLSRVSINDMLYGTMNSEDRGKVREAYRRLTEAPLSFDACHQNTHRDITACAIRQHSRNGMDLLIADHLHLMRGPEKEIRLLVSAVTGALKDLAVKLQIPIILVSQLSRECEKRNDKRPIMSDLKESSSIEQDADVILFVYRGEVHYPEDQTLIGTAELNMAKQREGPTGKVDLFWRKELQIFEEIS